MVRGWGESGTSRPACAGQRLAECACVAALRRRWEISGSHSTENSDAKAVGRPGANAWGPRSGSVLQIAATAVS